MSSSSSSPLRHAVNWFEIPVNDLERAQAFYEKVLATPLRREAMGDHQLAIFPYQRDQGAVGGCLISGADAMEPGPQGALVYLDAPPSLDAALERVQAAGGRVAVPKVRLPGDLGSFAHVIDTEGNRVGLHGRD